MKTRIKTPTSHHWGGGILIALLLMLVCGAARAALFLQDVNVTAVANTSPVPVPLRTHSPLGQALQFLGFLSRPSHGNLVTIDLPSGRVLGYEPAQDFVGMDGFMYRMTSSFGIIFDGVVNISVKNGLLINDVNLIEGNSGTRTATFTASLTTPASEFSIVTVGFRTVAGTALARSDFLHTTGTLTFAPGIQTQRIAVTVISDILFEFNETFFVELINPTSNAVILDGTGVGTILNDEGGLSRVGTAALEAAGTVAQVGEPVILHLSWTHPVGWRQLDSIDLLIVDDEEAVLPVRWHEAENHFSLYKPATDRFVRTARAGSPAHFETSAATMFLDESTGGGPPGQTVTIQYGLIFKPQASGRTFRVETSATDDAGNQQGFEQMGTITVLPR